MLVNVLHEVVGHLKPFRLFEQLIGAQGAQVLSGIVALISPKASTVALETPGYPQLEGLYKAFGAKVAGIPLDDFGIDVRALAASRASIAHVMPSHQFPTGRVMSIARRYELLGWAAGYPERLIVEDDYDWEFRFAGMPIPSLQSIDAQGNVVYLSTFSKSLGPALRMAFALFPKALVERMQTKLGFLSTTVGTIDQIALARVMESGDYERHLNRYRAQSKNVRDKLIGALSESMPGNRASIEQVDSGLHFVLALKTDTDAHTIAARALERGVRLAPLERYAIGAEPLATDGCARFIMQYDGLEGSAVERAVAAVKRALADT